MNTAFLRTLKPTTHLSGTPVAWENPAKASVLHMPISVRANRQASVPKNLLLTAD